MNNEPDSLFQSIQNIIRNYKTSQLERKRMFEKGKQFLREYRGYFEGKESRASFSQSLWYSMLLRRNRLKSKNIRYSFQFDDTKDPSQPDTAVWGLDGKNTLINVSVNGATTETYQRNEKKLYTHCQNSIIDIMFVSATKHEDILICPHCGATQKTEDLLDGCNYCGTQFQLEDFKEKVVSYTLEELWTDSMKRRSRTYLLIGILFVLLFTFWGQEPGWYLFETFITYTLLMLFIVGITIYCTNIYSVFSSGSSQIKWYSVGSKIRKHDKNFSALAFIGSLDYKLKAIHFAEAPEELQGFCQIDLSEILPLYKNVVDCNVKKYAIKSFETDAQNRIVKINVTLELLVDTAKRLLKKTEKISLTLIKDKANETQSVCDAVAYTCDSCGGSISLLKGGVCEYCGNKLDMRKYDWVITDYKIKK